MTDEVLVYIGEGAAKAPDIRQALDQAQQCSGGRLYVMPSAVLPMLVQAQVIRSPQDMQQLSAELSQSDSLFAAAWLMRKDKDEREGDGKAWDAPGYKAP
ncbi:hypothetical protein [Paracoccus xiamenensis]|uniref:hypothetical protein n=1 Tax=Paracoccus xiamenensis TaxID=2714901 RepID=UPI00140742F1|nr:hypothetical protein [Paracoccus xiamenensis]NHF71679.1 hypothetical protein [Paracoccus xiamenensis]